MKLMSVSVLVLFALGCASSRAPRLEVYEVPSIGGPEWSGQPISLKLRDVPIVEVLREIARAADLNMVAQQDLTDEVTVVLDRVPWDQALHKVLEVGDLVAELEGNIWHIRRQGPAKRP